MAWLPSMRGMMSLVVGVVCPETDLPISRATLRFRRDEIEAGFLAARKATLCFRTKVMFGVAVVLLAAQLFVTMALERWQDRERWNSDVAHEVYRLTLLCAAIPLLLLLPIMAVLSCEALTKRISPVIIEIAAIQATIAIMVVVVLSNPVNITKIQGSDHPEILDRASDSGSLLVIDGLVTAAHLGVPVRWVVMWPLELAGVLTYACVVFIIGSPELHPFQNLVFLTGLVIASAVGKRFAELGERSTFLDIIDEKSRRCEAEFALSQATETPGPVTRQQDLQSDSMPSTTNSGRIFDPRGDMGITGKLSAMAEIAKSEHWLIAPPEVRILNDEVLGRGGFGIVVRGVMSGISVAVKISNKQVEDTSAEDFSDICNELRIFRHLRHPNIVPFYGAIVDPARRKIALVLECIFGTILHAFIMQGSGPSTTQRYQVLLGICRALLHMHSRQPHIVHSDLKSTNVMVEVWNGGEVRPKLLDFGFSRVLTRGSRLGGGTFSWMAPEVVHNGAAAKCSADIYSYGHMVTFVATGLPPPRLSRRKLKAQVVPPLRVWPPSNAMAPGCEDLARACLELDQGARPSTQAVLERLLALADQLDIVDTGGAFLKDVRTVAEALRAPQAGAFAHVEANGGVAPGAPQGAAAAAAAAAAMADGEGPEGRLPPLLEEADRSKPSATATPETRASQMRRRWRPCPERPVTARRAMQATMITLGVNWNFERRRPPCCELHAIAQVAQELCVDLLAWPCVQGSFPRTGAHCPRCALIDFDLEDMCCDYCGTVDNMEQPPSAPAAATQMAL